MTSLNELKVHHKAELKVLQVLFIIEPIVQR
nr:MAG TPA: hypothetical protein [Caudoviricetes sp.]